MNKSGSEKNPTSLLACRLDTYEKNIFDPREHTLDGVIAQSVRFRHNGGNRQQERMIKDKRRSLDRAVWHSYQAAEIKRADGFETVRALINPNQVKQDYDDKILSVGFEYDFKCGDVLEWVGTNSYWLIYLQDLTELAYFRGNIRRCSYEIVWEDNDNKKHRVHAAVIGPAEKSINSTTSHGLRIDSPNYTLNLLIPKNEETLKYFTRYRKFYLQGDPTCWRVEAIDKFSSSGIIEVAAAEYYANTVEDNIDSGIVGGLLEEAQNPNTSEVEATIIGETFIKVKKTYTYAFKGRAIATWRVDDKYPVILEVSKTDPRTVTLKWDNTFSGQFELYYGNFAKTIIVESLF